MPKCSNCDSEYRDGAKFCDSCGAKIEPGGPSAGLQIAPPHTGDEGATDSTGTEGIDWADSGWPEGTADAMGTEGEGSTDPLAEPDAPAAPETDNEGATDSTGEPADAGASKEFDSGGLVLLEDSGAEDAAEPEKAGYLVFPDSTEQAIPESQWLIGRADLAKFLNNPKKANEISRGHLTVFEEDGKFFIEDGKTMVQDKPSTNKTWIVRGKSRILVTGTGRNELQDDDEIDVAELVKLQFVVK